MKFGERLRALRKQHGLSQRDLANQLGMSQQMISCFEKESVEPDLSVYRKISEIFNVPLSCLISCSASNCENNCDDCNAILEVYQTFSHNEKNLIRMFIRDLKSIYLDKE